MKFKPKEILVSLPTVLTFASEDEIVIMAASFNAFVHGKVKLKYEVLGMLGGQHVGLFYIQRNHESQQLRNEFMAAINQEEMSGHGYLCPDVEDDENDIDGFNSTKDSIKNVSQWHNDPVCLGHAGCMCVGCDPYHGMKP